MLARPSAHDLCSLSESIVMGTITLKPRRYGHEHIQVCDRVDTRVSRVTRECWSWCFPVPLWILEKYLVIKAVFGTMSKIKNVCALF